MTCVCLFVWVKQEKLLVYDLLIWQFTVGSCLVYMYVPIGFCNEFYFVINSVICEMVKISQLNILYLIFWIFFFNNMCIWRWLESSNHVYLDIIYLYSLKSFEISEVFFLSVLLNWGNKVFNCTIIMYNIYPERHLPDFKLILQGGGVEVTFCIVNDFVNWKEVKELCQKQWKLPLELQVSL